MVSNGEFNPLPQTRRQRQTETAEGLDFKERLNDLSEANAGTLGMDRRQFLRTSLPRLFVGYRGQPTLVKERLSVLANLQPSATGGECSCRSRSVP
jgi:hypothetical protein